MTSIANLINATENDDDISIYIKGNEGFRENIYIDTLGNPTIGYGFNLNDQIVSEYLPKEVAQGKRPISRTEADQIINHFISNAVNDSKKWVGNETFETLNDSQKRAVVDFMFNVGINKAQGFKKTKQAILNKDFNMAANELLNSNYAKQVKGRARRNADLLRSIQ